MTDDTPAWFTAIAAAVAPVGLETTIVIELRVEPHRTTPPTVDLLKASGAVDASSGGNWSGAIWQVVLGPESSAHVGAPHIADVVFTTDPATAAAFASGTTNAQQAISAGRLRVGGDLRRLVDAASELAVPR